MYVFFFFKAEDGIRVLTVTGVQTCALPILREATAEAAAAALGAKLQDAVAMASPGNRSCTISNRTPLTDNRRDAEFVRVAMQVRLRCGVAELATVLHSLETRSEEHTSELQSQSNLVCRL